MSALTLLGDLQTLFRYHLREPLSDFPRPEQRNAFHSEPLLGDPHQLLERNFAGIAKELDQTRRFLQASLITPSWNSVVGFLTDWEGLRRLAA